jgi:hypothetical protein
VEGAELDAWPRHKPVRDTHARKLPDGWYAVIGSYGKIKRSHRDFLFSAILLKINYL